jgi:hypothetical protein
MRKTEALTGVEAIGLAGSFAPNLRRAQQTIWDGFLPIMWMNFMSHPQKLYRWSSLSPLPRGWPPSLVAKISR